MVDNRQKYPVYGGIAGYAGGAGNINTILIGILMGGVIGGIIGGLTGLGQYAYKQGFREYYNVGWKNSRFYAAWNKGYHTNSIGSLLIKATGAALQAIGSFSSTPEGALSINLSSVLGVSGAYLYPTASAIGVGAGMWTYTQAEKDEKPPEFSFSQTFYIDEITGFFENVL